MAENKGFEPSKPFGLHAFQACAFDHSANSPHCNCKYLPHTLKRVYYCFYITLKQVLKMTNNEARKLFFKAPKSHSP